MLYTSGSSLPATIRVRRGLPGSSGLPLFAKQMRVPVVVKPAVLDDFHRLVDAGY
ncbi:MAG TPA: hypothetical protein VLA12_18360 [Planctomycetaceae bacterium]|nr:hypothetical protein [Planctomycetaceae bacterium]